MPDGTGTEISRIGVSPVGTRMDLRNGSNEEESEVSLEKIGEDLVLRERSEVDRM